MLGSQEEIKNVIPNSYYQSVYDIDYSKLKKENIDTILFDIDNTIANVDDTNIPYKTKELISNLKKQNFKILLFSNNHKERVEPVSKTLNLKALSDAGKPVKKLIKKP